MRWYTRHCGVIVWKHAEAAGARVLGRTITITITITIYYRPLASRTDIGLQHPSTTFLSRGRLLKHTRTPHLTQNTDPRNAHVGTKTQH